MAFVQRGYVIACCHLCGRWWPTVHDTLIGGRLPYLCTGVGIGPKGHRGASAYGVDISPTVHVDTHDGGRTARYHALAKIMHANHSRE